jgi:hypothetical protein
MGRRFGGQERSGAGIVGTWRHGSLGCFAACLCATLAVAGCGESTAKSASVAATTTAATTATTPTTTAVHTTPPTSATHSTGAKPPTQKPLTTAAKKTPASKTQPPAKASTQSSKPAKQQERTFGKIKVTSAAFKAGGPIGAKYTCDGAGISPPL